jgi:hypothetical protein
MSEAKDPVPRLIRSFDEMDSLKESQVVEVSIIQDSPFFQRLRVSPVISRLAVVYFFRDEKVLITPSKRDRSILIYPLENVEEIKGGKLFYNESDGSEISTRSFMDHGTLSGILRRAGIYEI